MRRLVLLLALVAAGLVSSAAVSSAALPGFGTDDTCAASLVSDLAGALATGDAEACGGFNPHAYDSGCEHPSVIPFGFEGWPYWALWTCWNPWNGWHTHVAY